MACATEAGAEPIAGYRAPWEMMCNQMGKMKLSIVLPTYNEAENLNKLIPEIKNEFPVAEIIIVDDNSPDGTAIVAEKLGAKVIRRETKEGIGAALRDGYNAASNDVIVSMDADCSMSVKDIHRLVAKLTDYDLVTGSKFSPGSQANCYQSRRHKFSSYWGNRFFTTLFRLPVDDATCSFRAVPKKVWNKLHLQEKTNVFFVEMLIEAQAMNFSIAQIPMFLTPRAYGSSKTNLRKLFLPYVKFLIKRIFRT